MLQPNDNQLYVAQQSNHKFRGTNALRGPVAATPSRGSIRTARGLVSCTASVQIAGRARRI